jgi:hypothetical protein
MIIAYVKANERMTFHRCATCCERTVSGWSPESAFQQAVGLDELRERVPLDIS